MSTLLRVSIVFSLLAMTGCDRIEESIAMASAPEKTPAVSDTAAAKAAKEHFWKVFHAGDYGRLDAVLHDLTAAYLDSPRDPETALLLGHAHFWKLAERGRLAERDPRVTEHALLAEKYMHEARTLRPEDDRILGWLGGLRMVLGSIHENEALRREGYFMLRRGVEAYPAFNGFSMSFPLSGLPREHERFPESVELMWRNAERCAGAELDRKNPSYEPYMDEAVTEGPLRVCWNSWIAPHNFEGFFLHFGDVLTKSGDWRTARKIYGFAKLAPAYEEWDYARLLEARIENAEARSAAFANADPDDDPEMMIGSTYACTGCHAE